MIRRWLIGFCAVLALSVDTGCGAPGPLPEANPASAVAAEPAPALPYVVISPTDEIADVTALAVDAWVSATGLDIVIGPGGVPVSFEDVVASRSGVEMCGVTRVLRWEDGSLDRVKGVEISRSADLRCPSTLSAVMHELGHVLTAPGIRSHSVDAHAPSGVFGEFPSYTETLDEASVVAVCAYADCPVISL